MVVPLPVEPVIEVTEVIVQKTEEAQPVVTEEIDENGNTVEKTVTTTTTTVTKKKSRRQRNAEVFK